MTNNITNPLLPPLSSTLRKQSVVSTTASTGDNELSKKNYRKYRGSRTSIFSRSSLVMFPIRRQIIEFENTYKIDVDKTSGAYFKVSSVEAMVREIIDSNLERYQYESQSAAVLVQNMTNIIKNRLKEFESVRYKYVCLVYVGQKRCGNDGHNNGLVVASQMLSQSKSGDNYAEVQYQNSSLFAVAIIYGIYFE